MMRILQLIFMVFALVISGCAVTTPPPTTAKSVNLSSYMGKWYEIASFPNRFQRGCRCTMAQYTLRNDGTVAISNTCLKGNNQSLAQGKAWVAERGDNSKLKVQFFWPFRANYWILAVSPNYQYALVGTPNRKYLWLLARHPSMAQGDYQQWIMIAKQKGYDVTKLQRTMQNCSFTHS